MNKFEIEYLSTNTLTIWANNSTEASQIAAAQANFDSIADIEDLGPFAFVVGQDAFSFDETTNAMLHGVVTAINFVTETNIKVFVRFDGQLSALLFQFPEDSTKLYTTIEDLLAYLSRDLPLPIPPLTPPIPTGLLATSITATSFTFSWNAVVGATGYRVYKDNALLASNVNVPSYSITGLTEGTEYTMKVSAVNAVGESAKSVPLVVETIPTIPTVPMSLAEIGITYNSINLEWDAVADADTYNIYLNSVLTVTDIPAIPLPTYLVTALNFNTVYTIEVSAENAGGESPLSSAIVVTTYPPVPAAPVGFTTTSITKDTVVLDWAGTLYAASYNTYVDAVLDASGILTSNATKTGLTPATSYDFNVTAENISGESPLSTTLPVLTLTDEPTGLALSNHTATTVKISWSAVAGADSYAVYKDAVLFQAGLALPFFVITGLSPATSYSLTMTATNATGESDYSSAVVALTRTSAPVNLLISNITSTTADADWDVTTGAVTYSIYKDGLLEAAGLITPSYSFTGLLATTSYDINVTATNASGESAYSLTTNFMTV